MNTTLNIIRSKRPCRSGWETLLKSLGKTEADDAPVSFGHILKSNGIEDAIWCLKTLDYKDICLFCADVAESVLLFFEEKHPGDLRPRKAIEGIRLYKADAITLSDLGILRADAAAAAYAAADAAAYPAAYAYAAADAAAYAAADAAAYATAAAYAAADTADTAADADARKKQWKITEELFIKHFCRKEQEA